jgi:hypothetical protein
MPDETIKFSFETLATSAANAAPLTVCPDGHLVVSGRTHWQPMSIDTLLTGLICRWVEHEEAT